MSGYFTIEDVKSDECSKCWPPDLIILKVYFTLLY